MLRRFESCTRHASTGPDPSRGPGPVAPRVVFGPPLRGDEAHVVPISFRVPGACTLVSAAPIAQSAERLHGKEKVKGSIPFRGSDRRPRRASTTMACRPWVDDHGGVAQVVRAHGS